jgi:UDP-N-acetylmuramoyl-tripeptide--D-alanyl-D-alanine ligase
MSAGNVLAQPVRREQRRVLEFNAQKISEWCGGTWDPHPPTHIVGVSNDTRSLRSGNLYVAISGDRFDGHEYVNEAFAHGASASVVRSDWNVADKGMCLLRVSDPRRALGDIARGYRRQVNPDIVGITGSAGKTSVKELTAHILSAHVPTAKSRGNWNNDIGLPLSLLEMDSNTLAGVFEVATNHPGEIASLCSILEPDWGVVTNIGAAHIGYFGSIEAIAEEKSSMLRHLPTEGIAVLDCGDVYYARLRDVAPNRVVTVSTTGPADYQVRKTGSPAAVQIHERETDTSHCVALKQTGDFHAANLAFAVATARTYGMAWEEIRDAVKSYIPPGLRWQVELRNGVRIVNDAYNANPLSMQAALHAFAQMDAPGRKCLVLAGMMELGTAEDCEHAALGEIVARGDWAHLIVVGKLGEKIARAALRAGWSPDATLCCLNNTEAAKALRDLVREGDAVLLKGSRVFRLEEIVDAFVNEENTQAEFS